MQNLKSGDLLISTRYANVWDNPGDVSCSTVIDYVDERQPVIVISVHKRKYYEHEITELMILTPSGNIGWVAAEKANEIWTVA